MESMSEIDRDAFLELLDQLLSDSDDETLAAARAIKQQMTEADVGWDMLLVKAPSDDDEHHDDFYDDDDDEEDTHEEEDAPADELTPAGRAPKDALTMIEELLRKHEISEATREELEEYKIDVGEGDFSEADQKYLLALYRRVTGKKS